MPTGDPRRGRRDNGLVATTYAVVGDVDPRVGEHLLDVLAVAGIAAYLQPAADLDPVTRSCRLPSRPVDRLYVDHDHLDTARRQLTELSAGKDGTDPHPGDPDAPPGEASGAVTPPPGETTSPPPDTGPAQTTTAQATDRPTPPAATAATDSELDIDVIFADIVASFRTGSDVTGPRGPERDQSPDGESVPRRRRRTDWPQPDREGQVGADPADERQPTAPTSSPPLPDTQMHQRGPAQPDPAERSLLDGLDLFGADLPDNDTDDRYEPPPPPPLPRISRASLLALITIAAGLTLFFWPAALPMQQSLALLLGFTGVLSGVVTLVWRLRPGDDEDDTDDGARV